jgi:hypothetical protein
VSGPRATWRPGRRQVLALLPLGRLLGTRTASVVCVHGAHVQYGGLEAQGVAIVPAYLLRSALGGDRGAVGRRRGAPRHHRLDQAPPGRLIYSRVIDARLDQRSAGRVDGFGIRPIRSALRVFEGHHR